MDKKVINDIENKNKKPKTNKSLLIILIMLFCFTLYITGQYIIKYNNDLELKGNEEIIEITNKRINASIVNNGFIDEKINSESFKNNDEIIIEKINVIEIISSTDEDNKLEFDINYNIINNEFKANVIPSNKSEVLVRFAYSYDEEEWTYVNNVISTNTSNISPLIGNNYDISGLITNLRIATDFEISAIDKNKTKMYWKSETTFKNLDNNDNIRNFKADFTIDYKTNS